MRRCGRSAGKLRRVAACRLKPLHLDNARRLGPCVILTRRRGQLLELQLHLIDEPLATFGARTEYLPFRLREDRT